MQKVIVFVTMIVTLFFLSISYAKEIPFAQDDRDRLIRLETKIEEGFKAINQRFEAVNQRIDDLRGELKDIKTFMLWGFGILFGGMGILIGFVIWDRRTALTPVTRRTRELEEREELLEKALKEYAKENPRLAEILKSLKLM
jgi:hypothetical protein